MALKLSEEQHRQIRHMPLVLNHIAGLADEMRDIVNELCLSELTSKYWKNHQKMGHFGVIVQTAENASLVAGDRVVEDNPDHTRPRAYVHPIDGKGIRIEMTHSVMLKAAAQMAGK